MEGVHVYGQHFAGVAYSAGTQEILLLCYISRVAWEVEYADEFEAWWHTLSESEQGKVDARVGLLLASASWWNAARILVSHSVHR